MFKEYKRMFKELRNMQEQLWRDSMARFPGSAFPVHVDEWQHKTLRDVNNWAERAVRQSLELQREWVDQWAERVDRKKLKPKMFAELSAEARKSTQRLLDNQNQLLNQWLRVLGGNDGSSVVPKFQEWEKSVQDSMSRQTSLLTEWSKMTEYEELSAKEMTKLSNQIVKAMRSSIDAHEQLWSHWFDDLSASGRSGGVEEKVRRDEPKKSDAEVASMGGEATVRAAEPADDLKQISGIGAGLEKKLKEHGVSTFRQIAQLSDDDIEELEGRIIRFSGRIKRDNWVEQARKLMG